MIHRFAFTSLVIFIAVLFAGCSKSPESTVENFFQALEKAKLTEAKSFLSAQSIEKTGEVNVIPALANYSRNLEKCGGIKKIEVNLSGEGEIRTAVATIQHLNNDKCPIKVEKVELLKENGTWKILL